MTTCQHNFACHCSDSANVSASDSQEEQQARVEKLVNDLARPIMVWRFARAKVDLQGAKGRGARTSLRNATNEIDKIVCAYTCGGPR
jgi:hypothetical protein